MKPRRSPRARKYLRLAKAFPNTLTLSYRPHASTKTRLISRRLASRRLACCHAVNVRFRKDFTAVMPRAIR